MTCSFFVVVIIVVVVVVADCCCFLDLLYQCTVINIFYIHSVKVMPVYFLSETAKNGL